MLAKQHLTLVVGFLLLVTAVFCFFLTLTSSSSGSSDADKSGTNLQIDNAFSWTVLLSTIETEMTSTCSKLTLARKCNISHWFPYGTDRRASGRAGGRVDVRSRDYQNFLDGLVTNRSRVLSALQTRRKTNQMNSKNFPGELSSEIHWFFDSFGQQKLKLKTKL